jgi:hypothetical protein
MKQEGLAGLEMIPSKKIERHLPQFADHLACATELQKANALILPNDGRYVFRFRTTIRVRVSASSARDNSAASYRVPRQAIRL